MSFKELQDFFERWIHHIIPASVDDDIMPYYDVKKKNYFLIFLKLLPPIFIIIYFFTLFYVPLQKIVFYLPWKMNTPIYLESFLRMIAVTGLVGYGTNYIAIKMLFHPRYKRPILGQGLIPASKVKIAYKLGESITREVINHELIFKQLKESGIIKKYFIRLNYSFNDLIQKKEFQEDLIKLIEFYMNSFLHSDEFRNSIRELIKNINLENISGLEGNLIKFYKFFKREDDIAKVLENIIAKIDFELERDSNIIINNLEKVPEFIQKNENAIEHAILYSIVFIIEKINLKRIIVQNLLSFDELRLERLLLYSTSDQLQYIQYLGAFLGALGGLFITFPLESFIIFTSAGIILVVIDVFLFNLNKIKK